MSMIAVLQQIPEAEIDPLLANPSSVVEIVEEDEDEAPAHPLINLDKAWHAIHYLLTGTAWEGALPLASLMVGGEVVGSEEGEDMVEVGYGPARVLRAEQVRAFAAALEPLGEPELRARFDGAEMTRLDIYPNIWDRPPAEDDTLGYVLGYYAEMKAFVRDAAERGAGLLVYIT